MSNTAKNFISNVQNARSLRELCSVIESAFETLGRDEASQFSSYITGKLPKFGGAPPSNIELVWSWDEDELMICTDDGEWDVIDRKTWESPAA
jgi:hypothetical protein